MPGPSCCFCVVRSPCCVKSRVVGEYACKGCFDWGQGLGDEVLRQCRWVDEFSVGEFEASAAVVMPDGVGARRVWARRVAGPLAP